MLRHTLATLSYRAGKVLHGTSATFGAFQSGPGIRTPVQILAHMGDLLDWALALANGRQHWHDSVPMRWDLEVVRFFGALQVLDNRLAQEETLGISREKLFQGPLADALTHVGQIALLRRAAGEPVRGENYVMAEINAGAVGPEQPRPRREFD